MSNTNDGWHDDRNYDCPATALGDTIPGRCICKKPTATVPVMTNKTVPIEPTNEQIAERLLELVQAGKDANWGEFTMRIPADFRRDFDLVMSIAAKRLTAAPRPEPVSGELLPCPFCAGQPVVNHIEPHTHHFATSMPDHPGSVTIECNCVGVIAATEDEAKRIWNRRAPASGELARLARKALLHLNKWLDAHECDCEMLYVCGRPDIERTVRDLGDALGVKQEKGDE